MSERRPVAAGAPVVLKIGSSSIIAAGGRVDDGAVRRVIGQVRELREAGYPTVLVTSGAVAAGRSGLGEDPTDITGLQVAAAVGQTRLIVRYHRAFAAAGCTAGQVLITRDILAMRSQYLHARDALGRMLEQGIVPVVNENDTVAVEGLRVGDNDRLAAIVSHLVGAGILILLTDTDGLYSSDPRSGPAELLTEVRYSDPVLEEISRGASGPLGSGGAASKVAAAQIAAWSGIPTVVARSDRERAASDIAAGGEVGTYVVPRSSKLPARKLWLAFGQRTEGTINVDRGAAAALVERGSSLLSVGVTGAEGDFTAGAAVEIRDPEGNLVAKGAAGIDSARLAAVMGQRSAVSGWDGEVIHRDRLVILTPDE